MLEQMKYESEVTNDGIKIEVSKKVYAKDTRAATTQVQSISGMSKKK